MSDFEKQVNDLLERAMQQPGVTELMEVYAAQKEAMDAHARAQEAVAPRWVAYSSTTSQPL